MNTTPLKIANKRAWRRVRSRLIGAVEGKGKLLTSYEIRTYHLSKYRVLNTQNKSGYTKRGKPNFTKEIIVPEQLCFHMYPEETGKFFNILSKNLNHNKPYNLFVVHKNTTHISVAASFLFDQLITQYRNYWKEKKIKINLRGEISDTKEVNNFLAAFGFLKEANINIHQFPDDLIDKDYASKFLMYKKPGGKFRAQDSSLVSKGLVDYFNKCFRFHKGELTDLGSKKLTTSISELVDNAEEHSGREDGKWFVSGCYNKEDNYCYFSIISVGNTISQNLSKEQGISDHVQKNYGGFFKKSGSKMLSDPIWVVTAIQEGISSKRNEQSDRGQGLMDAIEFIDQIRSKEDDSQITIISGNAVVNHDFFYKIVQRDVPMTGGRVEKRRFLYFNEEASFKESQDAKRVFKLAYEFRGTIITGRFKIGKEFISNLPEEFKNVRK